MMSLGIRSGVNWMRRKSSASASPSERTSRVLPSPGTPSSRQWPPASRPISNCSTTSPWPTMTRAIASRNAASLPSWLETAASVATSVTSGVLGGSGSGPGPGAVPRQWTSRNSAPRRLRSQRIHHDVDRELRIVLGQETLVAPVVIPLAPVVLVAVEDAEAAADLDTLEIVVDEVV